jgi:hypothetical protein
MNKIILGTAAVAVMVAATVVWSKSLVVEPHAVAKAEATSTISPSDIKLTVGERPAQANGAHVDHAHGIYAASDRDYGWGPFRTVDW